MANRDMCLKAAQKAFPHDEKMRVAYMLGINEGYDRANEQSSLQQEQQEVDYNKFEKLFDEFCESNKGHHITSHDACMWFWELGLNARKEDTK